MEHFKNRDKEIIAPLDQDNHTKTDLPTDEKYLVNKESTRTSLASKIGAGLLGAVAVFGGSNVEAGGYTLPSPEEMKQIEGKLRSLEAEYQAAYKKPISLKYGMGEILWVDKEDKRNPWRIRIAGGMFEKVDEVQAVKNLPVFELAKLEAAATLPYAEKSKMSFTVESSPGTTIDISEYGYVTMKVAGVTINPKDGKLYSADGKSRADFTVNGKSISTEVYGKKNEMVVTVCTQENADGGVMQKAFTVQLSGDYVVKALTGKNILENCR